MLGMPNPRSLKGQQSESKINHRLISFAVIYPCTSDAHESEIIPHDLTLLRKSPDVIITAMFNSLYGRSSHCAHHGWPSPSLWTVTGFWAQPANHQNHSLTDREYFLYHTVTFLMHKKLISRCHTR